MSVSLFLEMGHEEGHSVMLCAFLAAGRFWRFGDRQSYSLASRLLPLIESGVAVFTELACSINSNFPLSRLLKN